MTEQSPQSWQSHGSRLCCTESFSPNTTDCMVLRGNEAESVARSQTIVQLPQLKQPCALKTPYLRTSDSSDGSDVSLISGSCGG
ncbi:hypothetical protein SBA4_3200021 [Candidatus Sulfopaludibacter sp. SbA4]|nr:hypothetical protein SBA4_3200021 [Candidatus Sulfopaludibacter sp. SbA4]